MATFNIQQIAAGWIVKNNSEGVKTALVQNGILANRTIANGLSLSQLASVLYTYYTKTGSAKYAELLISIPINENLSPEEDLQTQNAYDELLVSLGQSQPMQVASDARIATTDFASTAKKFWDLLVGGTATTTAPVVTITTKASATTIGLIIGGVAILAIFAWVITK